MKQIVLAFQLLLPCVTQAASWENEITTDLLIVGGTESGWAAAIQAARLGVKSITIVHDGEWLGGQFTEQALACVDENKGVGKVGWGVDWHPMKRSFHRSGLFKELMDQIEAFNVQQYGSRMPGRPYHGPSTFRPVEAEAIFRRMLQPYIDSGQVRLLTNHHPVRADVNRTEARPKLQGLWFRPATGTDDFASFFVQAQLTIDASDWGDAIQVAGAAFECGPDPHSRYGEPSAPVTLQDNPANEMNPITWAMIVVDTGQESAIAKPTRFDDRNYPRATHLSLAEFRHLEWDHPNPGLGAISHWPPAGKESPRQLSVYNVRRIVADDTSKLGQTMILLNYMNGQDYPLERLPQHVADQLEATEPGAAQKNIVLMTREQRQLIFDDAKQHALGVLYHLQNFVHQRSGDKTNSFRHFTLSEEFGTPDRLPPKPYIREGLRLKALYMMREQDGRNRDGETKTAAVERFAEVMYPDGLFAWQFHYDFHRTGRTYLTDEGTSGPWIDYHKPNRHTSFLSDRSVFPLRSFVPEDMDGLLGAQKNVGYSSIVSAAIRLHDQCIAIGQAAGAIATVAIRNGQQPREIAFSRSSLEAVRHALCGEVGDAVPLLIWPFRDLDPEDPAFAAINRLAGLGALPLESTSIDFHSKRPAEPAWRRRVVELSLRSLQIADDVQPDADPELTRGEFCQSWWNAVSNQPLRPFIRLTASDADNDGIADMDDPLPFTAGGPVRFLIRQPVHTPQSDGIPPKSTVSAQLINFCGSQVRSESEALNDHGHVFDAVRGFGWSRDITTNHRQRHALKGIERDTFLFTRERDRWEYRVPQGRFRIVVCVGDSSHEQLTQKVVIEGQTVIDEVSTARGVFAESAIELEITDGFLSVEVGSGKPNSNTCLNWLQIETLP